MMASRAQIEQTVTLLAAVTEKMPTLRVPLVELPLWAEHLDVDGFTVALRYDTRVWATLLKDFPGSDFLAVESIADVVRDFTLPPCVEGDGFGKAIRLPVAELSRLELLTAKEGAARCLS